MFNRVNRTMCQVHSKVRFALIVAVSAVAAFAASPQTAHANSKYAAFVIDANTGKTLFSRNADSLRYPASLTKIMTLYIMFEELRAGRIGMGTRFKVSKKASRQAPSKLGLKPGSTIKVRDAMRALITKSANDVAMVVAENISGSQARFARRMTSTARRLGMRRTTFRNPHGLPNKAQRTTARDMARLGRAIQQHFPKYYKYFKTRKFVYRGRHYRNHNRLLGRVKGVDGIKTGYTRASGFNLVSSARRGRRHIVAVVMGGKTGRSRDAHMRKLIATYLPKARRSNLSKGARIAKIQPAVNSAPVVARKAPIPSAKPDAEIITASVTPPRNPRKMTTKRVKVQTFSIATHDDPASAKTSRIKEAPARQEPRMVPGWQIQIGAMPSKTEALKLIDRARKRNKKVLSKRKSYTMMIDKNGGHLYRARFAGFTSKSSAKSACRSLKRKKFACYPIYE